ncbi:MAG: hypothetical protein ACRDFX_07165 [Chloroflexota bacterium]
MARWKLLRISTIALLALMLGLQAGGQSTRALAASAPANEHFTYATVVPALPYTTTEDVSSPTLTQPFPDDPGASCAFASGYAVWYRYEPQFSGQVSADTFGTTGQGGVPYQTNLSAFDGGTGGQPPISLTSGQQVACNAGYNGSFDSKISFTVQAGHTYYFRAGDIYNNEQTLTFHLTHTPPDNDSVSSPLIVPQLPYSGSEDTSGATQNTGATPDPVPTCGTENPGDPGNGIPANNYSVWYQYSATFT